MRLLLDVSGDQQINRTLLRMAGRVDDMSDGLEMVADFLLDQEQRQFASQGGYASGGWAPLAPPTLDGKRRAGQDLRILHRDGDLRASLTREGGDHLQEVTPSSLVFGSTVEYAKHHQFGTTNMPRRRPLELTEGDRRESVRILQRTVTESPL